MSTIVNSFFSDSIRKGMALIVPILLVVSMYWCFQAFQHRFEQPLSYLLGFAVYWLFWCIFIPIVLLGGIESIFELFHPFPAFSELSWKMHLLLWWPLIFPLLFVFIPRVSKANVNILISSMLLGIIIGITEEILWRGMFMRLFPNSLWLNLIYPSLMFATWHFAPQSIVVNRMPGGSISFIAYALLLGISYAITVRQTGSIAWCTIAHIIHDTLGLGGFAYAVWLSST